MAYADLLTIQTLNTGDILTAALMQQIRANGEFFIDPPLASVFHNTTQNVANSTAVPLLANSENSDNNAMHSTSVNTSRITAQTAGRHLAIATVVYSGTTGTRYLNFKKNNATDYNGQGTTVGNVMTSTRMIVCAAGDYVEAVAFQQSGGTITATLDEFALIFLTR